VWDLSRGLGKVTIQQTPKSALGNIAIKKLALVVATIGSHGETMCY
jgi:hypothetical protein